MVRVRRIIITNIQLIVPAKKAPTNYWHLSQPPPQGLKCKYDISFRVTEENLGLFRKVISLVIFHGIADFLVKYLTIFNLLNMSQNVLICIVHRFNLGVS